MRTDFDSFRQSDSAPERPHDDGAPQRRIKVLEKELRLRRKQAAGRIKSYEQQCNFLAREVYDNLGQMLAALQLNTALLIMENRENRQLIDRIITMEQIIQASIDSAKRISSALHPVMFDLHGLADAIEMHAQKFQTSSTIPCTTFIHTTARQLPGDTATAVFRIYEKTLEAGICLTNVTGILITLMEQDSWLTLSVRFEMLPFDTMEAKEFSRLASAILCEYVEAFGGKLRVLTSQDSSINLLFRILIR